MARCEHGDKRDLCELCITYERGKRDGIAEERERYLSSLEKYGCHVHAQTDYMCERAKHGGYPCTCGLDKVVRDLRESIRAEAK